MRNPPGIFVIYLIAVFSASSCTLKTGQGSKADKRSQLEFRKDVSIISHGGIIRGDTTSRCLALVFTGDEYADGGEFILSALKDEKVKASFFLTGNFYRNPEFRSLVLKLKKEGHYLGSHSDRHL
ncbi:MAG: cellulase, partial [Bacteroidales bacterium]|nr:cellulase [Bacteroidales bacterium]